MLDLSLTLSGGAKVQVTGQVTSYRPQATGQVTGHRSGYRPQISSQVTKNNRTLDKLFWTDVLLYKNKISQGTLMIFLSFKQY